MNRKQFESEFNEALALKNAGRFKEALDRLLELTRIESKGRRHPVVIGVVAGILYYDLGEAEQAMPYLLESVSLSPNSVRASLALFHALFDQGKTDEAFDEMKRFVSQAESEEYSELIGDLAQEIPEKLKAKNLTNDDKARYELILHRMQEVQAARQER